MQRPSTFLLLASLAFAPACVLSPTWGDEPTRRDPLDFSGMVSRADAPGRIRAWNHDTRQFDTIAELVATSRKYASNPDLFGWSKVGVRLADRYWVPTGAGCTTSGMANLLVEERHEDGTFEELATFDAAGEACLGEQLAAGQHAVSAGAECKRDDNRIVLFAPPQCVPARMTDATPPTATIRLESSTQAFERKTGDDRQWFTGLPVTRYTVSARVHDRDGGVTFAAIVGGYWVVCRRASDGHIEHTQVPLYRETRRAVTGGALVEISAEARRVIDVEAVMRDYCPTGYTAQRIEGWINAEGSNAAGTSTRSGDLLFRIP